MEPLRARFAFRPYLIGARIDDAPAAGQPARDPAQIRDRFMQALGTRKNFGAG